MIRTVGNSLKKWWPLDAVKNVEVDNVDVSVSTDGIEDCLICSEVSEAEEWSDLIE